MDQHPLGDGPGLDEDTDGADLAPTSRVRGRPRLTTGRRGLSVPGAIGGVLLITAIAFGATARLAATTGSGDGGPSGGGSSEHGATSGAGGDGTVDGEIGSEPGATSGAPGADLGTAADSETSDATADGGDAATGDEGGTATEPATEPTTDPTTAPANEPLTMSIALHLGDGKVTITWGDCPVDGFVAWKVVRSLDSNPSWPLGDGDRLVASSENHALGSVVNGDLPAGRTVYYRVVGLVSRNGETVIGCRTRAADIHIPSADPTPAPTSEPDPIGSIGLSLTLTEGGQPRADWTTCPGDWDIAFVVRSTNSGVSYPLGSGDAIAGSAGKDGATVLTDTHASAGHTYWYRVFCTRHGGEGYQVVAASPTREISTPAPDPLPDPSPVALSLTTEITDGGIALHWGTCTSEHFGSYRVIRSLGTNPSYLPQTDGSVVIKATENAGVVTFTDTTAEAGHTWHYRVQCVGWINDHQVLLGETDVASVTLP
jgi:hypothetical protein